MTKITITTTKNKFAALYYAAAAATAIAGILHLIRGTNTFSLNGNIGAFFIIAGIIQIFWALPMVRKWAMIPWYSVGIGGTIGLLVLWVFARLLPGNAFFIKGMSVVDANAVATELLQAAYIGLTAAIINYESNKEQTNNKLDTREKKVAKSM